MGTIVDTFKIYMELGFFQTIVLFIIILAVLHLITHVFTVTSSLIVCFDLELTDGSFASEIFQIGARGGEKEFKCHILPRGVIDWGVTKFVNGIKVDAKSKNEG